MIWDIGIPSHTIAPWDGMGYYAVPVADQAYLGNALAELGMR